jgi:tetratricopeptide (TPR) repeat protein
MTATWEARISCVLILAGCIAAKAIAQGSADRDDFAKLFDAGRAAMAEGHFEEARADFERLEKMNAAVAEVHATLGVIGFKLGNFDHAAEEIRLAHRLKPTLPGLDSLLAMALAESGKNREALPGLEKAFHSSTDKEVKRQAGLELTSVYTRLNMDRKAVETALELRDLYKSDAEVLYNVAKILGNSAYITMQSLFHGADGSVWAQLAEAEAHESQGQFTDAIDSYRRVLEIDPKRINIHYRIGRTYLAQWQTSHAAEDAASAAQEFVKELDVNPSNANAAYELAELRRKDGKHAEAQQLYESAIEYYPDFEEAEVGLGGTLLDDHAPALALSHLRRATELRPEDEVAWYRLARAERALGDAQAQKQALAAFQKLHAISAAKLNKAGRTQSQDSVTPQQIGIEAQQQ